MKSRWLPSFAAAAFWPLGPALARADEPPACPPGEWFCEDAGADEPPAAPDARAGVGLAPVQGEGSPPSGAQTQSQTQTTLVAPVGEEPWSEGSGEPSASPWALALRLQGVLLDGSSNGKDARLGGFGVSGRYALNPAVTFDLGLDAILGTDYDGHDRTEGSLSFSSLFFLNYHPVVRTYLLAGLNLSKARVDVEGDEQTWNYLGVHGGLGLEVALSASVALQLDLLAFMRGRTDSRAAREPEFVDEIGRVSNTSGGGLVRGGVTLRF